MPRSSTGAPGRGPSRVASAAAMASIAVPPVPPMLREERDAVENLLQVRISLTPHGRLCTLPGMSVASGLQRRGRTGALLALPLVAFLALFFVYPVVSMLLPSVAPGAW